MHSMQLSAVDLNLAVVLHSLIETRSITAAAKRLGLSQSATSHALARLRALLGDPLLIRVGRGVIPTPRALEIAAGLGPSLAQLERALRAFRCTRSTERCSATASGPQFGISADRRARTTAESSAYAALRSARHHRTRD